MQSIGFFQRPYEELRKEYEKLRPKFNITSGEDYNNFWVSDIQNQSRLHPCEKPQDLLQKIILTSSDEGGIVLDCFAGSGSTAIACMKTKRRFLTCEKDILYFNIACERIENAKKGIFQIYKTVSNQKKTHIKEEELPLFKGVI